MELSKTDLEDISVGLPGESIKDVTCSTLSRQEKDYLNSQTHPGLHHEQENVQPTKDEIVGSSGTKFVSSRLHMLNSFLMDQSSSILCGCWSPQGHQIAIGCADGTAKVMKKDSGQIIYKFGDSRGGYSCPAVRFGSRPEEDVNVIFLAQGSSICQFHVSTGQLVNKAEEGDNIVLALDVRQDCKQLASGGEDGVVRVYEAQSLRKITSLQSGDGKNTAGHNNHIYAIMWHPSNPQILISSGWDQTALIWDLRSNQSVRSIFGTYVCGGDAMDLNSSEKEFVTASWRKQNPLQIWDFGSGQLIQNVNVSTNDQPVKLYAAKFINTQKEEMILSGGQQKHDVQSTTLKLHSKDGEVRGEVPTMSSIHSLSLKHSRKRSSATVACQDRVVTVDIDLL